jgi:Spy/CpxP family protein refolding chaperone
MAFLAITPVQDKAMQTIQEQHRLALAGKRKALGEKAAALRHGMEDPALSEAQVRALAGAVAEARLQLVLEERATFLEIQGVLTAEQKAKAQRLRVKLDKEREAHKELMAEMGELDPMDPMDPMEPGAGPGLGR